MSDVCVHARSQACSSSLSSRLDNTFPSREMHMSRISKKKQKQHTFRFLFRAAFVSLSVCFALCPFGPVGFLLGAASMRVRLSMKEAARPPPAAALRCLLRLLALQQLSQRVPEALAQRKAPCWALEAPDWPQLWGHFSNKPNQDVRPRVFPTSPEGPSE